MRTHKPIYIDILLLQFIQQAFCESTLSIVTIDDQLSYPTYGFVAHQPVTSKGIASKLAINCSPNIKALSDIEVFRSKSLWT
jgi:hypothetical protein